MTIHILDCQVVDGRATSSPGLFRLPTGSVEHTLTYHTPFTKRNQEQDYAMVLAVLEDRNSEV